jgi:iron complex outermembrane recepter protein
MFRHTLAASAAFACAVGTASAQQPTDTIRTDRARTDSLAPSRTLEGVTVRAIRADGAAPIAQTTIALRAIQKRNFAQDLPLLLQGASPAITAHSESGTNWGYSYLRLRGIDQSRINLSIDGIPLNDPEDQVFYFANFADLTSSLQSVQVQRGVGTTGTGTASFAGSVNLETKSVLGAPRGAAAELQAGSFGARRVMVEGSAGPLGGGFASAVRLSALRTNSFRRNAGVEGLSGLAQIAWLGSRDMIKLMVLAGRLRDTLSYLAVPVDQLQRDRRINPLTPDEQDRFSQSLIALSHTRQLRSKTQFASTLYRIAAGGNYDIRFDSSTIGNFRLDSDWYGVTSVMSMQRDAMTLSVGVNANTYARDHSNFIRPDLATANYLNTGHKQDISAFSKLALTSGALTWFADLQFRHARFRYEPDARISSRTAEPLSTSWTFLNPKLGLTWRATPRAELFASVGRTTREPTRSDMLAGNDDITPIALTDLGGLQGVKPERVTDTEFGIRLRSARTTLELNAFRMDFRNEIARIGALSPLGVELRSNVASSLRQGVEFDLRSTPIRAVSLTTIGAVSYNRIREFTWRNGTVTAFRGDVAPLLTPAVTGTQRIDWRASKWVEVGVEARFQGRSFLQNDGDERLTLPSFWMIDAMLRMPLGAHDVSIRGTNLGNSQQFGSGYVLLGVPNYFILPPRSVFVTVRVATR